MENLIRIEEVLNRNDQCEYDSRCVDYQLRYDKDNNLEFKIYCEDEVYENYEIELVEDNMSVKSILQAIIQFLYEEEINYRQNFINKTKSFNSRKVKSLALWSARDKMDKVDQINKALIERHNTTAKFKNELIIYKDYVRDLYRCLNELCEYWKVLDIREYLIEKFEEFNEDIKVYFTEDYIIVCRYIDGELDKRVEVKIDNFTKKQSVYNEVIEQLKRSDCCFTNDMKQLDKMSYADMLLRLEQLKREKAELMKFESALNKVMEG